MKEFDYYIYIDYSEGLVGYSIIEKNKIKELLPKIKRFRHYRESRDRRIYLKHIKNTIDREKIKSYFERIKIKNRRKNIEIYADVLEFIKKHSNCIIFISVDDHEYVSFRKIVEIVDAEKIMIKKESELRKKTPEYNISLVLDTMLNIERLKNKNG